MFEDNKETHVNGRLKGGEVAYTAFSDGCCGVGKCGRLKRWLCGMRPAGKAGEQDYSEKLGESGMAMGMFAPTVFHGVERCIRCVVHCDE